MKVLLIGANGTLGQAVAAELAPRHEIIAVGRQRGMHQLDFADIAAAKALFAAVGPVDAVVATAGSTPFRPLSELDPQAFSQGFNDKLMGQINLVLAGQAWLNDGGSFTLVSGILADDPIRTGVIASTVNGALEAFVKAAAIELPRGLRINVVNPSVLTESLDRYADYFRGFAPVPASQAAKAFGKSVEGLQTGQIYRVR